MENNILNFLEKREAILWIKSNDCQAVTKIILENIKKIENKKVYIYENGITLNQNDNAFEVEMKNLYSTLDILYPEGIRKEPVVLLIRESIEEILQNKNLDYIKEIYQTKKENPKYNLTIIIIDKKGLPPELNNSSIYIKEKIENKKNIEEYIQRLANSKNIQLNTDEIEEIMKLFKNNIKKVLAIKKKNSGEKILEETVLVKGGKYKPSFLEEERETFDIEVYKYQVTQEIWKKFMGNNPSIFKGSAFLLALE